MDKLTAIKIKYKDGTYSDEIPVGVLSENVEWDSTHTLVGVLGSVDVDAKGTIQDQIDKLSYNNTQFDTQLASIGNVDVSTKGTLQDQIDKLSNNNTQFDTRLTSINDNLNDFATNFTNDIGNVDVSTKGTLQDQIDKLSAQGAGAHNSIYRGKNLGTSVTYKQWGAINAGTFDDLYIGDYWVINGVNWRIAAFDYYLNTGDPNCTTHHVVIVPDTCLGSDKQMNSSNITTGGYTGSEMYTTNLDAAKTLINNAFGSAHILNHRQLLTTAVVNGRPSAESWFNSTVELMNEQNVYGGKIFTPTSDGSTVPAMSTIDKSQFPLFALEPSRIHIRSSYWLRDIVSAAYFVIVHGYGYADYNNASSSLGVRPAFSIKS